MQEQNTLWQTTLKTITFIIFSFAAILLLAQYNEDHKVQSYNNIELNNVTLSVKEETKMDDRELSARLTSIEQDLKEIKKFIIEEIDQEEDTQTEKEIITKNIIPPKIKPKKTQETE